MDFQEIVNGNWLSLQIAIGVCAGTLAAYYMIKLGEKSDGTFLENLFVLIVFLSLLLGLFWPVYQKIF